MLDTIKISVTSGKWGDGCVAARREAGAAFGWPAGGDGGSGGAIIFRGSSNEHTLSRFRHHTHIIAKEGEWGKIKDQYGSNADDLIVDVPLGTIIKDTRSGRIITQLLRHDELYTLAPGGKGGVGNIHFKNAVNQYPTFALYGEPGISQDITLELQMLGDIGLIGVPSVGKSSIINTCCHTKAKIAAYHFTTLEPNIGIHDGWEYSFTMIDIPGLIEWAADGKWLGNDFLRHILKAKIFALVSDISRYETSFGELTTVIGEILTYIRQRFVGSHEYGDEILSLDYSMHLTPQWSVMLRVIAQSVHRTRVLFEKLLVIVANKYDMVNDPEIAQEYLKALVAHCVRYLHDTRWLSMSETNLLASSSIISAATHHGIDERCTAMGRMIHDNEVSHMALFDTVDQDKVFHTKISDVTETMRPWLIEQWYIDHVTSSRTKIWQIRDREICRLTNIIPRGNDQAEDWYWRVLTKQNHIKEFEKKGVLNGDVLQIMSYYPGTDDKFILYTM